MFQRSLTIGLIVLVAGAATACGETGSPSSSFTPLPGAPNPVASGLDLVEVALRPPAATPALSFRDDRAFDLAMNAAMRGETPEIEVSTTGWALQASSFADGEPRAARLGAWLEAIERTGGTVIQCVEPAPERRRFAGALVYLILGLAADAAAEALLYRPARSYHARAIVDRDTGLLRWIDFLRRPEAGAPPACNQGRTTA